MARRSSLVGTLMQIEREAARVRARKARMEAQSRAAYARRQAHAEASRRRVAALNDREQRRLYAEARADEVAAMNRETEERVAALEGLLSNGLRWNPSVDFARLKRAVHQPPSPHLAHATPLPSPDPAEFAVLERSGLGKMFGKGKYERLVSEAEQAYQQAVAQHAAAEDHRVRLYTAALAMYETELAKAEAEAEAQHAEVDALEAGYRAGGADEVAAVMELVLANSPYPDGFDQVYRLAFVPDSRQLVIEYELPTVDVVPSVKTYKYVKTSDTVTETPRPATQVRAIYAQVVAQTALRTLAEVFATDTAGQVETVVFNGVVDTVDPGNGQPIRPCLVTLRTTREVFGQLDLRQVEPLACLKHLSASVSKSPAELVPVRPVLDFSMVDPRFIPESDALALLDQRPNLLELSPSEFEVLIQNLFTRMGLEAKQTRASRDGGVDCVAYDIRPIFGGKVVIQAKRYKNTVGVSAVRDLYGTLQNEGASKGILVTTSGYGPASFEFARNKPIELIDGANLLYLLKTHADIEARIQAPDDWTDPQPDVG